MIRAHSLGRIYSTLALNSFDAGDLEAARRFLARGFAVQREVGDCAGCDAMLYPAAVPIFIACGDLERAEESCRKAEEVARVFRSRSWVATARYLVGLLALAYEDWPSAAIHFEEAGAIFETLGQPFEHTRTLEGLARARSRLPGSASGAVGDLIERAQSTYRELGSTYRAERVASLFPTVG